MEMKTIIHELKKIIPLSIAGCKMHTAVSAAAEAMELVAWAETNATEIVPLYGGKWRCYTALGNGVSDTLLGCIRAAKESM